MHVYETKFGLTHALASKDRLKAAREFLCEDNMLDYFYVDRSIAGKVESINWILDTVESGRVVIQSTDLLTDEELDIISKWVALQNTGSLGDTFSHRTFAYVIYHGDTKDEFCQACKFDTNDNYKFHRVD